MSTGGELIGDIAQGALTARALEPAHGEGDDGHTHESACLNCGTVSLSAWPVLLEGENLRFSFVGSRYSRFVSDRE